jgi:Helix-turn-helix domain
MKKIPSQKERVRKYLDSGKTLTRLNAWERLGILECPARISELRYSGYQIKTKMVSVKNRFGETVRVARWSKA